MSKTPKNRSFSDLPIAGQVRAAMPTARHLIAEGLSIGPRDDMDITDRVIELLHDSALEQLTKQADSDECVAMFHRIDCAFALGVAAGLLLRPEAFEIGGAR